MRYDYKAYNGLGPPRRVERRQSTVLTWKTGPIPALSDLPFLDPSAARPRLLIVGRDASAGGYPDWRAVAERKQRQWLEGTARNRTAAARALATSPPSRIQTGCWKPGAATPGRWRTSSRRWLPRWVSTRTSCSPGSVRQAASTRPCPTRTPPPSPSWC
jgi:hypothetical protein